MEISIIIPVYKRTEWIGPCIEKLLNQDYAGSHEIIIVDDGSPNETEVREAFRNICTKSPVFRFLRNTHGGPAAARNYGVRSSSGKILCFLDDDSLPDNDWLKEITAPFAQDEQVGLVSGRTLSYYREGLPLLLEQCIYPGKSWATCNIAYHRAAFETLNGFDDSSYSEPSWEDNDLGLRARWSGYRHVYNDCAIVYHPHEKSLSEYKKKCLLNGRGAAAFSRKYAFKKPAWSIATPLIMSRRLFYGIMPWLLFQKDRSPQYLKFLWSFYSLRGFLSELARLAWKR